MDETETQEGVTTDSELRDDASDNDIDNADTLREIVCDEGDGLSVPSPLTLQTSPDENVPSLRVIITEPSEAPEEPDGNASQKCKKAKRKRKHVSSNSEDDCPRRSPRQATVQSLFDWYFDSSDEGEDLNTKSQSPEDLRAMFHNVLNKRCFSPNEEDPTRGKPEIVFATNAKRPCHQSQSLPSGLEDFSSRQNNMDEVDGAKLSPTGETTDSGDDETEERYGREFDEEEQLKGHYDDVINVFKGVCSDLDVDNDKHLTRMLSTNSMQGLDYTSDPVKHFIHEPSFRGRLRRLFIRNSSTRLPITFFDFALRFIICVVYMVRVSLDDHTKYECNGSSCGLVDNSSESESERDQLFSSTDINWYVLLWVHRSLPLWIVQVTLAAISLTKALIIIYATGKGHRMEQVRSFNFLLEILCSVPILITLCYPSILRYLFVPVYLNCWLARRDLEQIYNDLHLTSQRFQNISVTLWQQMVLLLSNLGCLVLTNVCTIQHLQRSSKDTPLNLLDATYFIIVTFSTVGYGDISPDIWVSQIFMVLMICVAIASIPNQIEGLVSTWMERKKSGGEYRSGSTGKHVIVCSSFMSQASLMDFLTEFYAHPKLEEHMVILLCSHELESSKHVILKDPKWSHRVIYMKGSSLNDSDLSRCHAQEAVACFFLAPRPCTDKAKADEHTILRSWAVKDFAPNCKQYIQLFSAVNKLHVKFAEHVVCEDEFKYALLANNCLYPGLSTLVSLLVHTTSGQECVLASESWQQVYGRHSGNEIYHIQLQKSAFFSQYAGESFTAASADAHHRFGVSLLAVLDSDSPTLRLQLNPGPEYILKGTDFCFYMSVTREEYSQISPEALRSSPRRQNDTLAQIALALQKYHEESENVQDDEGDESVFDTITSLMGSNITKMARSMTKGKGQGDANTRDANFNSTPTGASNNKGAEEDGSKSFKQDTKDGQEKEKTATGKGRASVGDSEEDGVDIDDGGDGEKQRLIQKSSINNEEKPRAEVESSEEMTTEDLDDVDHRHGAGRVLQFYNDMGQEKLTIGPPPVTIYAGPRRATCHIMTEPRQLCCLEWGKHCDHCAYKNARDERWQHQLIILAAEHPKSGIFNFIVPLRSSFIGINGLCPIVLLLEEEPDSLFLDTMAQFPLVYWMIGSIHRVDDLLLAGINKASHLVVVNRDSSTYSGGEDILGDSETIVAVQTIFKLFPNTNVVTELTQASNMRFMQFSASDSHIHRASRIEKKLKHAYLSSNFNHIYRLPFAAGQVFSASMLDTLLYQIRVKRATIEKFPEFGQLYAGLCSATGEIPFAIYRTERLSPSHTHLIAEPSAPPTQRKMSKLAKSNSTISEHRLQFCKVGQADQGDMGGLIHHRLKSLDLLQPEYSAARKRPHTHSYVIINPSSKMRLRIGDIIYVLQPSSMYAKPSRQKLFVRRSVSCRGPATKTNEDSRSGPEQKIGRFKLRRHVSEKAPATSMAECAAAEETEKTTGL